MWFPIKVSSFVYKEIWNVISNWKKRETRALTFWVRLSNPSRTSQSPPWAYTDNTWSLGWPRRSWVPRSSWFLSPFANRAPASVPRDTGHFPRRDWSRPVGRSSCDDCRRARWSSGRLPNYLWDAWTTPPPFVWARSWSSHPACWTVEGVSWSEVDPAAAHLSRSRPEGSSVTWSSPGRSPDCLDRAARRVPRLPDSRPISTETILPW